MPLALLLGLILGAGISSVPWLFSAASKALLAVEAATRETLAPYWPETTYLPEHQYRLVTVYLVVLMAAGALGLARHHSGLNRLLLALASGLTLGATASIAVHQAARGTLDLADAAVAFVALAGTLIVLYEALGAERMRPGGKASQ